MIDYIQVILLFISIHVGGAGLLRILLPAEEKLELEQWLPLSWALGLLLHTVVLILGLLALGRVAIWQSLSIAAIGALVFVIKGGPKGFGKCFAGPGLSGDIPSESGQRFFYYLFGAIVALYLGLFFHDTLFYPLTSYDGRAIWAFKAKILFYEKTYFTDIFTDEYRVQYHRDYPPLIPFLEYAVFEFIGHMDDVKVKFVFFWFLVNFVLYFFHICKKATTPTIAMFFTMIVLSSPHWFGRLEGTINSGGVDMPLTLFAMIAAISLHDYWKDGKRWRLALAGLMAGACVLTKNEGLIIIAALTCVSGLRVIVPLQGFAWKKLMPIAVFVLISGSILALWSLVKAELPNYYDEEFSGMIRPENIGPAMERAPRVIKGFFEYSTSVEWWNVAWICYFAVLLISIPSWFRGEDFFLHVLLLTWMGAYLSIYGFTPLNIDFHMKTSLMRLISHVHPIAMFLVAVFVGTQLEAMRAEATNTD